MERRRIKHEVSFEERLAEHARRLKEQAKTIPPGKEPEHLMRRARQAEITSHISVHDAAEERSNLGLMGFVERLGRRRSRRA